MARFKIVFVFALSLIVALLSYGGSGNKHAQKIHRPLRLDECDTLFQVTIHPEGNTIRLRWAPLADVTSWIIFRATNSQLTDLQIVATIPGDSSTWLESSAFVTTNVRAFYRIAAHWDQGTPGNYRVIEDFDGMFLLQSYSAREDSAPNGWRPYLDGAFNPNGRCIEMYGNTWKKEQIDTVRIDSQSVWQVSVKCLRSGTLQAIGMADSANEMWYTFWGTREPISEAWNHTYQSWYPDSQWVQINLPVGEDWQSRFGYCPLVRQLMFANDNDDSGSAGIWRIDEIRDVTGAISLPPVARFHWSIRSYPTPDTMEVAFCSMGCDPDGPLYSQFWSFGDATNSTETSPVHRYAAHRAYQVTLSIIDSSNRADYVVQQVADTSYTATRQINTIFTGDVMIARRYTGDGSIIDTWGADTIFNRVQPLISSFDLAMCNLECPFTNSNQHHPTKSIYYKGRPEYTEAVKFAGFDLCALANNHSFDYMVTGMHDTKHLLDSLGILSTGDGDDEEVARQPVFFSKNGLCVAVLSFCNRDGTDGNEQPFLSAGPSRPGFAMWDRANIEQMIPAVRRQADVVIVQVHSGIEYATTPPGMSLTLQQREDEENPPPILDLLPDTSDVALRKYAIDLGADLIINHHPHVVEGCQVYNGHLIAHSMGNFAFDQQFPETFLSMAIQAQLSANHHVAGFIINPIFIDRYIPAVPTGELGGAVLDYIADLSRPMNTWAVRSPNADTSFIVLDTTAFQRTGINYVDTLALEDRDSFAYSAPFLMRGGGYPVSMALTAPAGSQYRIGRELLMWGNIEQEGATPWNLNSAHERYDTQNYHGGQRSIGLDRAGPPASNSVSTNLVYRQVYPYGQNCTIMGWIKGQNSRNVNLQFEFYDGRTGGHFLDSLDIGGVLNGTFNWTRVWQDLVDPHDGYCYDIKLRLVCPTSGTGYAWFDDMALVQWENWNTTTTAIGFPSNIRYVQVRAPLGTTTARVSYRREWVQAASGFPHDPVGGN